MPLRRLIFLLCAVVLLLDLADDGCLGEAKLAGPPSQAAKYFFSSSSQDSGQVDSSAGLPPENLPEIIAPPPSQPVFCGVANCVEINHFFFFCSSGGLPL